MKQKLLSLIILVITIMICEKVPLNTTKTTKNDAVSKISEADKRRIEQRAVVRAKGELKKERIEESRYRAFCIPGFACPNYRPKPRSYDLDKRNYHKECTKITGRIW